LEFIEYINHHLQEDVAEFNTDSNVSYGGIETITYYLYHRNTSVLAIVYVTDREHYLEVGVDFNQYSGFREQFNLVTSIKKYFTHFSPERMRFISGTKKLVFSHNINDPGFSMFMEQGIQFFDFSVRSYNILKRNGCHTLGDLLKLSLEDIKGFRHMGQKSINEISDKLRSFGFELV